MPFEKPGVAMRDGSCEGANASGDMTLRSGLDPNGEGPLDGIPLSPENGVVLRLSGVAFIVLLGILEIDGEP